MKLIHGGFTKDEKEQFRTILQSNLLTGLQELVKAVEYEERNLSGPNLKKARFFKENCGTVNWDAKTVGRARDIWLDEAVQGVYRNTSYPMTISNFDYIMNNIDRITSREFVPTDEDIIIARQRTTGCYTTNFTHHSYHWNIIDVGGQKPERVKWLPIMKEEELQAVIFIAAIDEFNVRSTEEDGTKLDTSIKLFKEVVEDIRDVGYGTVMLFLNKVDSFSKKILYDDTYEEFVCTFPDYKGPRVVENCIEHVFQKFVQIIGDTVEEIEIHHHPTCALDTEAMSCVFDAITKDLYVHRLASTGSRLAL